RKRLRWFSRILSANWLLATSITAIVAGGPGTALAYRPFEGTDADVAEPNKVEIEFQPVGYLREGSERGLTVAPTVVNIGFAERWEAVFEGKGLVPLSPSGPMVVTDAAMFLKHV